MFFNKVAVKLFETFIPTILFPLSNAKQDSVLEIFGAEKHPIAPSPRKEIEDCKPGAVDYSIGMLFSVINVQPPITLVFSLHSITWLPSASVIFNP